MLFCSLLTFTNFAVELFKHALADLEEYLKFKASKSKRARSRLAIIEAEQERKSTDAESQPFTAEIIEMESKAAERIIKDYKDF